MAKSIQFPGKITDTSTTPNPTIERWWKRKGARMVWDWQKDMSIPESFHFWDLDHVAERFRLKGWEFGRYTSQEDRYNYVMATGVSFYHLCTVAKIPSKAIGVNTLTIAIGSRGRPGSKGTFWPSYRLININRWPGSVRAIGRGRIVIPRQSAKWEKAFRSAGGSGCLAHEWGHWMDMYAGVNEDRISSPFLSGGSSTKIAVNNPRLKAGGQLALMEKIFETLYGMDGNRTKYAEYLSTLKAGYWTRRNEVFARTFEMWVAYKLKQRKITNEFLCYGLSYYSSVPVYPDTALLKKVDPLMTRLVRSVTSDMAKDDWSGKPYSTKFKVFKPKAARS